MQPSVEQLLRLASHRFPTPEHQMNYCDGPLVRGGVSFNTTLAILVHGTVFCR